MSAALVARLAFWLLFAAAVYVGDSLVLQRLPAMAIPALVLALAAVLFSAYFRLRPVQVWVDTIDLRTLVLLHVTRFVGAALLVLYHRGQLPHDFAVPAGFSDIVIAAFALPVGLAPLDDALRRRAIAIWNVAGLVSSLLVVASLVRVLLDDATQLAALTHLPLSLLPTFLLPVLLASHLVILARLSRATE